MTDSVVGGVRGRQESRANPSLDGMMVVPTE